LTAKERAQAAYLATMNGIEGGVLVPAEPYEAAKAIPDERLDGLRAMADSVTLQSPELGTIRLVAALGADFTNAAPDAPWTMTFEDAATLRLLVDAFPGARVVQLRKGAALVGAVDDGVTLSKDEVEARTPWVVWPAERSHDGRRDGPWWCSICLGPQRCTPSGWTCDPTASGTAGHGGAEGLDWEQMQAEQRKRFAASSGSPSAGGSPPSAGGSPPSAGGSPAVEPSAVEPDPYE
jgi:hypothetical protein